MEWKLYDEAGEFLQEVNCEYDSCDISRWEHGAVELRLDFKAKKAFIIRRDTDGD